MIDFLCYNPMDSYIPNLPKEGPVSFIRFLNLYNKIKRADVKINGYPFFKEIGFRKFTPYIIVPSGQCKLNIYSSGKTSRLLAGTLSEFLQNMIYTIAIYGTENPEIIQVEDIKNASSPGEADIRLIQLSLAASGIDLLETSGIKLFENLPYKGISKYTRISEGKHTLKGVSSSSGKTLFVLQNIQLQESHNYSVYTASSGDTTIPLFLIDGSAYINNPKN